MAFWQPASATRESAQGSLATTTSSDSEGRACPARVAIPSTRGGGKLAAAAGPAKAQPKKKPREEQQPDKRAEAECPAKTGGRPREGQQELAKPPSAAPAAKSVIKYQKPHQAEDMPLLEQCEELLARGDANLPRRIHGPGYKATVSRKRFAQRSPKITCLCSGLSKQGGQPLCQAVYETSFDRHSRLFTITETGEHGKGASDKAKAEAQPAATPAAKPAAKHAAKPAADQKKKKQYVSRCNDMLKLPQVYKKQLPEEQVVHPRFLVAEANLWSRNPELNGGQRPFKVSTAAGFRQPTKKRESVDVCVQLVCTSCALPSVPAEASCTWMGSVQYSKTSRQLIIGVQGQRINRQTKAGGLVTQEQRSLLQSSSARAALGRLVPL